MSTFVRKQQSLASLSARFTQAHNPNPKLFLLLAALVLGFSSLAFSATVAVGTCTNLAFYTSIQTAINSVPPGSTVRVCPGTYPEQVLITKNLTLIGVAGNGFSGTGASGANNPVILPPVNGVVTNASDLYNGSPIAAQVAVVTPPANVATPIVVNISNVTVDGTNNQLNNGCGTDLVGIYYQNANGIVNHVVTRFQELSAGLFGCQGGLAIFAESGYSSGGTSAITIENSSVHDYQKNGITVDGSGTVATVMGNYVVGIGATPLIAQNGIQVSDGANGKVTGNTVTDDVYVNPQDCQTNNACYSATGILMYDSGGSSAKPLSISTNTVSNSQGGIVTFGDSFGTADYNTVALNKVTTSPAAGPYLLDGIDLCSNNNMATGNTVFNSSGSGVHIDSQCTESTGSSGNNTTVANNTINEACAGVLTGNGSGNSQSGNTTYNVVATSASGDVCPVGISAHHTSVTKLRPAPKRH